MPKLKTENLSLADAKALLSGEALDQFEEIAQSAHNLTVRRFGKTIKLYAPIYISNTCINGCAYCGFSNKNKIERRTLTKSEIVNEAKQIISKGHRHLLLVAGEDHRSCPVEFIEEIAKEIRPLVAGLTIEVQPFSKKEYAKLFEAGVDGVTLYQETYDKKTYESVHLYGPKSNYESRFEAISNAGEAGMKFLGIGALLGLSSWREETLSLITHAKWLMKRYWRSAITISVPRLRDSKSDFKMPCPVSDLELAQMICVLRLALPDCGIVLSTREPAMLRDKLLPLGITQMSAGSVTSPGGYTNTAVAGEQFQLEDTRSPDAVAKMLKDAGYDPVWKDWDFVLKGC